MIYCEKPEFGHISRSLSLHAVTSSHKRSKNLTQIGFLSLRSVKPDRLLAAKNRIRCGLPAATGYQAERRNIVTAITIKTTDGMAVLNATGNV